jgi:hypothetical protein
MLLKSVSEIAKCGSQDFPGRLRYREVGESRSIVG